MQRNKLPLTEMIKDGMTRFLFRSGEAQDLARAVNQALSYPGLREQVAFGGLQLMRERYSWNTIGQTMATLYCS